MSSNYNITDIHGHYVFGVDDGAETIAESIEMIKLAYEQGVRNIFCTSHDTLDICEYNNNLKLLKRELDNTGMDIELYPGCEVMCEEEYLNEIIEKLNNGFLMPMSKSNYVLMEFSPWTTTEEIRSCVSRIRSGTDYEPIIAHIERYMWLYDEPEIFECIKEMNLKVQINAYSLAEAYSPASRDFTRKLLKEKLVTFIGSDAHGTEGRAVELAGGVKYIYENCDKQYADDICYMNAERYI